ncbi:hypothetical protein AMECASPLE_000574 [Ameca splendens]|uniref:Uncharacterized protein n=1 Tax=Ameca splendens TaxID=208324 RepID=A0ABV0XXM9_9TELE
MLHSTRAQNLFEDSSTSSNILLSSQSLLLLALTVTLSGTVYLWILRYVCIGCVQPVAVGPESEALAVMV